jgi:hypothetical protein|nr:hypothetical protein [uncultured Lachnoclostridium sp.]
MTLEKLYMKVAGAIHREEVMESLSNATFLNIVNNKVTFKTFVETDDAATAQDLATEYILPRYIVFWKMKDSMWFIEGAETETELNSVLKAKTSCKEVTMIIRVDSKSEVIDVVRDCNILSINKVFKRKSVLRNIVKL